MGFNLEEMAAGMGIDAEAVKNAAASGDITGAINSISSAFADKGIVPSAEGKWIHFDYVPDEYEVRFGSADVTGHVVVIGTNLNEDELRKLFKK